VALVIVPPQDPDHPWYRKINMSKAEAHGVLKENAEHIMTTHFDTHATLIWSLEKMMGTNLALNIRQESFRNYHGNNLFNGLDNDPPRSCEDAGLGIDYCPCIDWSDAKLMLPDIADCFDIYPELSFPLYPVYKRVGYSAVNTINQYIAHYFVSLDAENVCQSLNMTDHNLYFGAMTSNGSKCMVKLRFHHTELLIEIVTTNCADEMILQVEVSDPFR
jgi:hypothetical protein